MYNKELENAPYRIWFSKVDEDDNPITVERYDRKYKTMGRAWNTGVKLCYEKGSDYRFRVAKRNPWKEYECAVTCSRCGEEFLVPEAPDGWSAPSCCTIFDSDGKYRRIHKILCPDCIGKMKEFLGVKEED